MDIEKEKIKIGIVTFWTSEDNYGQILQMFALYNYLKKQEHDVFVVKYNALLDNSLKLSTYERIIRILINPKRILNFFKSSEKTIPLTTRQYNCNFKEFRERNFSWSKEYFQYNELKSNPPEADIFICGSDIIWVESPKYKPYFLDFVKGAKKVAFSPSFGSNSISKEYKYLIEKELKTFSSISVREESGMKICKSIGFLNTLWMPDPTMLLTQDFYSNIEQKPQTKDFVFLYLLGSDTDVPFDDIFNFCNSSKLELIYNAVQGRVDNYPKISPTVEQWIGYMHYAEYIITNSFHGCIFAIIFNKKFVYLPLKGKDIKKNERIYSLLNRLSISDRIYNDDISKLEDAIDYDTVNKKRDSWLFEAKEFLNFM